jgi:hypothetical protein
MYEGSSPTFEGCEFKSNTTEKSGGGASVREASTATFLNCLFEKNLSISTWPGEGGGGACTENANNPRFESCTFRDNAATTAGGMLANSDANFTHSILWDNAPDSISGTVTVDYSDVQLLVGVWPGIGNLNADPLFFDGPMGGPLLNLGSPCIDAGAYEAWGNLAARTAQPNLLPDAGLLDLGWHLDTPANPSIYGIAKINSAGQRARIDFTGEPAVGAAFSFDLENALPGSAAFLLYGFGSNSTSALGGILWVDMVAFKPAPAVTPTGDASIGWTAVPPGLAGLELFTQYVYTDLADPFGFGMTQGMSVTLQ